VVPQVVWVAASAVGLAGFGAPAISGAEVALAGLAAGGAGLGVPAFWVAVSVFVAGCGGFGAPASAGLELAAGSAGFGAAAGLGAAESAELEEELGEESAGFGLPAAFAPSELLPLPLPPLAELLPLEELPLLEALELLAGLGATWEALSPPLEPPGEPATSVGTSRMLATVRTAAVVGDNATEAWVEVGVESRVAISHTSATAPNSSDTDPARHIRDNTATTTRARTRDWARDRAGAETGGIALVRCLPAGVTDIITRLSTDSGHRDGELSPQALADTDRPHKQGGSTITEMKVSGAHGTQIRPEHQPRSHHAEASNPSAEHSDLRFRHPPITVNAPPG